MVNSSMITGKASPDMHKRMKLTISFGYPSTRYIRRITYASMFIHRNSHMNCVSLGSPRFQEPTSLRFAISGSRTITCKSVAQKKLATSNDTRWHPLVSLACSNCASYFGPSLACSNHEIKYKRWRSVASPWHVRTAHQTTWGGIQRHTTGMLKLHIKRHGAAYFGHTLACSNCTSKYKRRCGGASLAKDTIRHWGAASVDIYHHIQ